VLLADESGATDYRQTEPLQGKTWAKKVFRLDSAQAAGAELFFYGGAREVTINGQALPAPERLVSTGWSRVKLAPGLLKAGANEILFKEGQLLLEPGRKAGHSFKSTDGGKTWSADNLGAGSDHTGEYLIRLRLGRYAPRGWAVSPTFDLWAERTGAVATPGRLLAIPALADTANKVPGTRVDRLSAHRPHAVAGGRLLDRLVPVGKGIPPPGPGRPPPLGPT
jgi:hypothetical protein